MFELSIAFKYLIPRWRQLSVSIISIISTFVIALVVWLIVVFFSVKDGLENSWVDKIIAVTAPVRINPTERYYQSYYNLIDSLSAKSDYTFKNLSEKLLATHTDPYDEETDEEIPATWPKADLNEKGELKDLTKLAFEKAQSLEGFKGVQVSDYETTFSNLRLRLLRNNGRHPTQQFLEHATFLGSFDADTSSMAKAFIAPTAADFNNLLQIQDISLNNIQEENPVAINRIPPSDLQNRLKAYFDHITIESLKTPEQGWRIPRDFLPKGSSFNAIALSRKEKIVKVILPISVKEIVNLEKSLKHFGTTSQVVLNIDENKNISLITDHQTTVPLGALVPLEIPGGSELLANVDQSSLNSLKKTSDIRFQIKAKIQDIEVFGNTVLGLLEVGKATLKSSLIDAPIAFVNSDKNGVFIPQKNTFGEPLLIPRSFKETKALIGDQGFLSYFSPTPSAMQEQRVPVYIAGFYDPGIIPMGGKLILANKTLVSQIQSSSSTQNDSHLKSGINMRFNNIADASKVKVALQKEFEDAGIAPYWTISTYQEYEFTKDIIEQLQSEKNLFSLISLVIIVVACSNIISMLIILVNDKKLEIGILRSMGASSLSIATIFGICGVVMGATGSIIGIVAAIFTLKYVNELVGMISKIQGHDLFNPIFYGNTLPTDLSIEALSIVMITTALISLLAGIVPAFKASMMKPSAILRSE